MLSQKFVFPRSKNFTSDAEVRTTPSVPIDPVRTRPRWGLNRSLGKPTSDTVACITPSRVKNQQKEPRESIPCYSMLEHSGESLLWTRWFVHSNIGRRPVCIWLMRRRFRSREGPTHREPFRPVRADSLAQGVDPLPPPWSEP